MFSSTMDRDFTKNFLISCGAHVLLVLVAFLGGKLVMNVFKNSGDVEIIRSSVRVDVVGMPKFTVQELREMQKDSVVAKTEPVEVQGKKEETKAEAEDVINKNDLVIQEESKKKKNSFLSIVSDYSSKKVAAKDNKKGTSTGVNHDLNSLVIEGNRLSKGSSLVGEFSDADNSEFSSYVQTLPEAIRPFWKLPGFLKEQSLKCRIRIYISAGGQVLKLDLMESSGNEEYDNRALKAIKDATFAAPSATVAARLTNSGIILGFPL